MKRIGIVSYNIYGNFTNYGSALQSWALHQAVKAIPGFSPVLVDYCPETLKDMNPLQPMTKMWDAESRRMCELSLPDIRENYRKFECFYTERFERTKKKYTAANFDSVVSDERLDGFLCGSDTIFCMDEFGFDDGYYANFPSMRGNAVAYAASFGDPTLSEEALGILEKRLQNFRFLGLREAHLLPYVRAHCTVPVQRVLDPTLLFSAEKYDELAASERLEPEQYLLYYSRRRNPEMERYAETLAAKNGWKLAEISLRYDNAGKGHRMLYRAGVEEFLSLVKNAEYVVTNSYHGMIFAVQYQKPFAVFHREQCCNKITELLRLLGLSDRSCRTGSEMPAPQIDYEAISQRIRTARILSLRFLRKELEIFQR